MTEREEMEAAIAEGVKWSEHEHTPRPCCVHAILDALESAGWTPTRKQPEHYAIADRADHGGRIGAEDQ